MGIELNVCDTIWCSSSQSLIRLMYYIVPSTLQQPLRSAGWPSTRNICPTRDAQMRSNPCHEHNSPRYCNGKDCESIKVYQSFSVYQSINILFMYSFLLCFKQAPSATLCFSLHS